MTKCRFRRQAETERRHRKSEHCTLKTEQCDKNNKQGNREARLMAANQKSGTLNRTASGRLKMGKYNFETNFFVIACIILEN